MVCERCGEPIDGWYLTYKGMTFCRTKDDACLKDYLFDEADENEQIGMDVIPDDYPEDLKMEENAWKWRREDE